MAFNNFRKRKPFGRFSRARLLQPVCFSKREKAEDPDRLPLNMIISDPVSRELGGGKHPASRAATQQELLAEALTGYSYDKKENCEPVTASTYPVTAPEPDITFDYREGITYDSNSSNSTFCNRSLDLNDRSFVANDYYSANSESNENARCCGHDVPAHRDTVNVKTHKLSQMDDAAPTRDYSFLKENNLLNNKKYDHLPRVQPFLRVFSPAKKRMRESFAPYGAYDDRQNVARERLHEQLFAQQPKQNGATQKRRYEHENMDSCRETGNFQSPYDQINNTSRANVNNSAYKFSLDTSSVESSPMSFLCDSITQLPYGSPMNETLASFKSRQSSAEDYAQPGYDQLLPPGTKDYEKRANTSDSD